MKPTTENNTEEARSSDAPCSEMLAAVTETRQTLSALFTEQALGLRDDINEQAESLFIALYQAGAKRAAAMLEKYAPMYHGLSHERKCPACGGWWPRHAGDCEISEVLSQNNPDHTQKSSDIPPQEQNPT